MCWLIREEKYYELFEIYAFMTEEEAIKFKLDWKLKGEIFYEKESE